MSVLAQIFTDTVRSGGSLVFIKDQAPVDLDARLQVLVSECEHLVPFCLRSAKDLEEARCTTNHRDLVLFFENQRTLLQGLNKSLQGQRLFFTTQGIGEELESALDFGSTEVTLQEWTQAIKVTCQNLKSLKAPVFFEKSFLAPCLFLDRDNVVVKNVPYNTDPAKVELLPGIADLINKAHKKNYWVAIVTNQSGLGRGRIQWTEYQAVHQKMLALLAAEGAWIDETVWSSYIESSPTEEGRLFAGLRKPRGGMFQQVHEKLKVDLARSVMIGDSATDLIAADSVGISQLYLLHSEKHSEEKKALEQVQALNKAFKFASLENLTSQEIL
ncbi:D-glycero-beta-D-manno-heptose-1,7-bisphosphate 7-phosphatase [compost metagenome]